MKILSVQVDDEVYDVVKKEADRRGIFVSELIRGSLGWESVDIYPNTLDTKKDRDLLLAMAVSELFPNEVIDVITNMLKHISNDKKKTTLQWIQKRYSFVFDNLKLVNYELIQFLDSEEVIEIGEVVTSFTHFITNVKKTKTNIRRFIAACGGKSNL